MKRITHDQQLRTIAALTDGCSIRTTERLVGIHRDTITRLGREVGERLAVAHDRMLVDLNVDMLELDEQWSFLHTKEKRRKETDPPEYGDQYSYVALDATSRAIISYRVGKRDLPNTRAFIRDLRRRVVSRPLLASDGWLPYVEAIREFFGEHGCDFGQMVKKYGPNGSVERLQREAILGTPPQRLIRTSYVERVNLTARMRSRRFTRKSNGFSKVFRNHVAAFGLHVFHYNFVRMHETLRMTPALSMGLTDHLWSLEEMLEFAFDDANSPPPGGLIQTLVPAGVPRWAIVHEHGFDARAAALLGAERADEELRHIIEELARASALDDYKVVRHDVGDGCVQEARTTTTAFPEDVLVWFMVDSGRGAIHLVDIYRDRILHRRKRRSR